MSWILCCRPKDCRYCIQGFYGLIPSIQYAKSKYKTFELVGRYFNRQEIFKRLDELNPSFFFAMAHGYYDKFTDNFEDVVWHCGNRECTIPPDNLKGRIVYLWSCLTGRELGHKIIDYGAVAFIGYKEEWIWITKGKIENPYNDPYARGFFEAGNQIIFSLLDGKPVCVAVQDAINVYNTWIEFWKKQLFKDPYASECIKYLAWDRDALVQYGNIYATLIPCEMIVNKEACMEIPCCIWYHGSCHTLPFFPDDKVEFTISIKR